MFVTHTSFPNYAKLYNTEFSFISFCCLFRIFSLTDQFAIKLSAFLQSLTFVGGSFLNEVRRSNFEGAVSNHIDK